MKLTIGSLYIWHHHDTVLCRSLINEYLVKCIVVKAYGRYSVGAQVTCAIAYLEDCNEPNTYEPNTFLKELL